MTGKITNTTFTPQEYLLNGRRAFSVWAVIENWAVNEEGGHSELLYGSREDAARVFQSQLAVEANEGCIADWAVVRIFAVNAAHPAMSAGWTEITTAITTKSFWRKSL